MATTQYYGLLILEGSDLLGSIVNDNPQKIDTALHNQAVDIAALKTLIPTPGSGDTGKFLRGDHTWQNIPLPGQATSTSLGTLKIGYTTSGKNYALQLDSNGKGYVNVPWTDTTYADATTSAHGLMTAADKTKLNGIAAGAQVNPGAATTSAAGLMSASDKSKLDGIAAGAQVNPGVATTSANGLMSKDDKTKLNGIAAGAQVNPGAATQSAAGLMSAADKKKLDGITAGAQPNPGVATTSANGLMSSSDKSKLNGIAAGAQVNPGVATSSANGLMSASDKSKLDGIAAGAQKNPGNFGGATASKAGSAGLVPAPAAGGQYKVLYGEGGWATVQDLLNATGAIAPNKMNGVNRKLEFKWGEVNNVPAINGQSSKLFDNAFSEACLCVFTQLASSHNGVYARIRTYGWDKNGFGYQAQTGDTSNVSFYYLAIGY